jgi:hypothetical protein
MLADRLTLPLIVAADWERVSVVVCPGPNGGTAVAALLSQHNHDQLLNCSLPGGKDGCNWETGDDVSELGGLLLFASIGACCSPCCKYCCLAVAQHMQGRQHLAVYSGLHSHANYAAPGLAVVAGEISNGQVKSSQCLERDQNVSLAMQSLHVLLCVVLRPLLPSTRACCTLPSYSTGCNVLRGPHCFWWAGVHAV